MALLIPGYGELVSRFHGVVNRITALPQALPTAVWPRCGNSQGFADCFRAFTGDTLHGESCGQEWGLITLREAALHP